MLKPNTFRDAKKKVRAADPLHATRAHEPAARTTRAPTNHRPEDGRTTRAAFAGSRVAASERIAVGARIAHTHTGPRLVDKTNPQAIGQSLNRSQREKLLYRVQHPAWYVSRLQTIPSSDAELAKPRIDR